MDIMDIIDQIGDLKNTICSLKAVAGAFSNRYTEGTQENNLLAVQVNPEDYTYLFYTITGLICSAKDQICNLETAADRLLEEGSKDK